jgi:hypothetical protein
MKPCFALLVAAAFFTFNLQAGPETIVRERAKELRDQNNVRQGVPPPTQPQPATPGTAATMPQPSPALGTFQIDLGAIKAEPTVDQKQKLTADILTVAQGAKPSAATAGKFAEAVAAAVAEKQLPPDRRARLAQEMDAVLNPGKYPQAKLDGIFNDVQAIFQDNGLHRTKAVAISDALKAMSTEVRNGGAR